MEAVSYTHLDVYKRQVAKQFNEEEGIDRVVLTKLDGDTRGGAALYVRAVTGKPIKYVGCLLYTSISV